MNIKSKKNKRRSISNEIRKEKYEDFHVDKNTEKQSGEAIGMEINHPTFTTMDQYRLSIASGARDRKENRQEMRRLLIKKNNAEKFKNCVRELTPLSVANATTLTFSTLGCIIGHTVNNSSDSSRLNRLTNATAGFNSTVSESTDWSTVAGVGAVALGALAIAGGVGIYCYLSKKVESYNNSLDLNKIEYNQ